MPTVTNSVRSCLTKCQSWHLRLDKLSFEPGENKIDALKRAQADYHSQAGAQNQEGMARIAARTQTFLQTIRQQYGSRLLVVPLVNSSRLLLHLGRASVHENVGLYCDRTTGLPMIPGSAVKGVLSTWACWEGNETALYAPNAQGEITLEEGRSRFNALAKRIFGDNSSTGSTDAGEIVFLGAFPKKAPVLGLDIVTPHTDARGADRPPIPSPFLAVEPGPTWHFAFLAKPRGGQDPNSLLETVHRWLTEALEQSGIGAKTAAGYGRFLTLDLWNAAQNTQTSEAAHIHQKAQAAKLAEIRAGTTGDYTEVTFKGAVLNRLGKPGEYQLLQKEVDKLVKNPDNATWILKLTEMLRGDKDARKRLKEKDWFPKEWLPQ